MLKGVYRIRYESLKKKELVQSFVDRIHEGWPDL